MTVSARLSAIVAVVWLCMPVAAVDRADPQACTRIADRLERLACYDRLHGVAAPAPADAEPEPEETTTPSAVSGGFGAEQLPEAQGDAGNREEDLTSTVISMGEQLTGRHWFRLENGQLWSQVSPERNPVAQGDRVRISRGMLDTYSLRRADGGTRSTAVRRLE